MGGVPLNGTSSTTQVSSARSPGGAGWIANDELRRIGDRLNSSIIKALTQGQATGQQIKNGRFADVGLPESLERFLLIVSSDQHYMGNGLQMSLLQNCHCVQIFFAAEGENGRCRRPYLA